MHSASELADWWDRKIKESDKALLEFVDEHPDYWVVGAVAQTGMEFTGAMVFDVFRFGEGAAESWETGKISPLVQDVFRGMSIAGGIGKAAQVGRAAVGKALSLYANVGGNLCAPIATGNALRRTGQALFLSLEEIAAAHGIPLAKIAGKDGGVTMAQTIAALRKLGVTCEVLPAVSWQNLVARLLRSGDGVMMLRVVGKGQGHRIVIQKLGGTVKILDRYGEFANLEALSKRYFRDGAQFMVDASADAVFIKRIFAKLVDGLPTLMVEAAALIGLAEGKSVPDLDRQFDEFKGGRGGPQVIHLQLPPRITVNSGDSLSSIALKHYGSVEYWPLVWDTNRETVGNNPNRIRPGMVLLIPPLSAFSGPEKENAKRRHPTWRNYH